MTKGYGFSVEELNSMCPSDFEPYINAYRYELETQDSQLHTMGAYVLSAVTTSIQGALHGKNSKVEYVDKPFSQKAKEEKKEMSQSEIKKQQNAFLSMLLTMQANFELEKESEKNEFTQVDSDTK